MTVYRACPPGDFSAAVTLDQFLLVYHRASGQTHMLVEPAPEILEALAQGEGDAATIAARLAERYGLEDGAVSLIAERLAELAGLGLIEAI